jgi:hypothetical protein
MVRWLGMAKSGQDFQNKNGIRLEIRDGNNRREPLTENQIVKSEIAESHGPELRVPSAAYLHANPRMDG